METNFFLAILGLIAFIVVLVKVRNRLMSEKESFFWVVAALGIFILSIFPQTIDFFSRILGISYPPSLLFLLTLLFVIYLLFRQSQHTSQMNERVKELTQRVAILDLKIREFESREEETR